MRLGNSAYEIIHEIGQGGMGRVFMARRNLRKVALKVVQVVDSKSSFHFDNEVEIGRSLVHRSHVGARDSGREDDLGWIEMRYIDGWALDRHMRSARVGFEDGLRTVVCIADVLTRLHQVGIVHCDVKPSNVIVNERGEVHLIDFGIATRPGQLPEARNVGTPPFVAPELLTNERPIATASVDVFSLGVLAFQLMTLELPWTGTNSAALLWSVMSAPPRSFEEAAHDSGLDIPTKVMTPVHEVIHRAIAQEPADRFATPEAFSAALRCAVLDTDELFAFRTWSSDLGTSANGDTAGP